MDGVAGADEVVEGGDDGEAGADGGFVVQETAAAVGFVRAVRRFLDGVPEIRAAGEGFLVGRHDADAFLEKGRISVCDILAAGVVDEDPLAGEFV